MFGLLVIVFIIYLVINFALFVRGLSDVFGYFCDDEPFVYIWHWCFPMYEVGRFTAKIMSYQIRR